MAIVRSQKIQYLYRSVEAQKISSLFGSSTSYSKFDIKVPGLCYRSISNFSSHKSHGTFPWILGSAKPLHSMMAAELSIFLNGTRSVTTQVKAPPQARQMGALKVSMMSPGIVYEPYAPREYISFWQRCFTRSGWRRTKEDLILELKSAYAIAKLRKSGYSKQQFYQEATQLYKEINSLMASGNKTALRKAVTENMYSALKNEIKQRESMWSSVYWELVEPVDKIRTLQARLTLTIQELHREDAKSILSEFWEEEEPRQASAHFFNVANYIGVDKNDLSKLFVQLTLEFLAKQKFEAYNSKGAVVSGDKTKEVLVRDIWVFEKSLFHQGAYWRLCGRISL